MTDTPEQQSRLDRIEALLERVAINQITLSNSQANTQQQLNDYISTAQNVLARNAVMDDVLLELHESTERHQQNFERHQQNFENNQRSIEAALNRLESMVLQIIRRFE